MVQTIVDCKELENLHREFVDKMFPHFGLTVKPEYALVAVRPLLSDGGWGIDEKGKPIIKVNDILNAEESRFTIYHESSHHLHPQARKWQRNVSEENRTLGEIIAHLGSLVFLQTYNKGDELEKYISSGEGTYGFLLAHDIFRGDKSILAKIANMNMRDAEKLFGKHLQRPIYQD